MKRKLLPLLILIVGLPQLSETVYTPALPDISQALGVADAWIEYTLTIYLAGFAVGTLFWGRLSDRLGRKPCLLLGFLIYILGCIGCYFSGSITLLMISRFIQAFGGSTGSVVGQAVLRDSFQGVERGKAYSILGTALAFSPAIGPIVGGMIDQNFGWPAIFLFLILFGLITCYFTYIKLLETHFPSSQHAISLGHMTLKLIKNPRVMAYSVLVAGCSGITFSFYAEGPFYLIEILGMNPVSYGSIFIGAAMTGVLGGWLSRKMHDHLTSLSIIKRGIGVVFLGSSLFMMMTIILNYFDATPLLSIILTIGCMMIIMLGIALIIPSSLSLALDEYRNAVGTASSLFGFFYYSLASLVTLGMGSLHNGSLLPMPIYFWGMTVLIWIVFSKWIAK